MDPKKIEQLKEVAARVNDNIYVNGKKLRSHVKIHINDAMVLGQAAVTLLNMLEKEK